MTYQDYARLETKSGKPVMLKCIKVKGELRGLMFEASVEQTFHNPTDKNIEVVYTFPLPWGAVQLGVDVLLGNRRLTGTVVEKKLAEAKYEEALSEGNAAIMLEKNHDFSYTLNLGNLAAQEDCVINLHYAQTLQFEQRGLRLLIPTVIAPRYGDPVADGGLQPYQATGHDFLADYPFDIELMLRGGLASARIASPSHPVSFLQGTVAGGQVLTVSLARRGALDRDFVLVIDQLTQESVLVLGRDCVEATRIVALASFCPRFAPKQGSVVMAVKILVDCSGSMNGDSLDAAKRSLQAVVQQLGQGDRFSLSRFGSTVKHRSRGLWTATPATRLAAQRWVGDLLADMGGTEMASALSSTFALAQTVPSDVLIVTDGEISAIDNTIGVAKTSGHRLFVVGIGSSPAEANLRRLAEATGGACDFVAPGEAVEPAVLRMFARLRSPRLSELEVVWPEGVAPEWVSKISPSVFDGDTVNVFALLKQPPVGAIRLFGRASSEQPAVEIGRTPPVETVESGGTLSRLAAVVRLASEFPTVLATNSAAAKQLAVAYQLVTDQTNFLLGHLRAEEDKPTDMPDLHKVDQMLAAGWGGAGSISKRASGNLFEVPTVFRRVAESVNPYRIADADPAPRFSLKRQEISNPDRSQFWSESESYKGLTPLGLSDWLRAHPAVEWPTTYAMLGDIGLGSPVIDWLELTVANRTGNPLSEATVVRAFLNVMSQKATYESLANSTGVVATFKALAQRITVLLKSNAPAPALAELDASLVESIVIGLEGMTGDVWPDPVFALGTVHVAV